VSAQKLIVAGHFNMQPEGLRHLFGSRVNLGVDPIMGGSRYRRHLGNVEHRFHLRQVMPRKVDSPFTYGTLMLLGHQVRHLDNTREILTDDR